MKGSKFQLSPTPLTLRDRGGGEVGQLGERDNRGVEILLLAELRNDGRGGSGVQFETRKLMESLIGDLF